jgi:hypothetical protein
MRSKRNPVVGTYPDLHTIKSEMLLASLVEDDENTPEKVTNSQLKTFGKKMATEMTTDNSGRDHERKSKEG